MTGQFAFSRVRMMVSVQRGYNDWAAAQLRYLTLLTNARMERQLTGRVGQATTRWLRARARLAGPKGRLP